MLEKRKVAFYSQDTEYRERFMQCWMRHYNSLYDFYTFETPTDVIANTENTFDVMILDVNLKEEVDAFLELNRKMVFLHAGDAIGEDTENIVWEPKYQEVYKIHDVVQRLAGYSNLGSLQCNLHKIIGVFSLGCEDLQIPFAAMTASEYAEKKRTVMINLQPYSGWETQDDESTDSLSMEDFILSVQTGNYSKSRLMGAIGHENTWDYVYSVKNTECLAEVTDDTYKEMLKLLTQELGYEMIIINFGAVFLGVHSLMNLCERIYFLTHKPEAANCREEIYFRELEQKGYGDVIKRISKIELPYLSSLHLSFRQIVQQWRWGLVGDTLRKSLWME